MTQSKMDYINARFHELGISRYELAQETLKEQTRHNPWMTLEDAYDAVEAVIRKREVQHALSLHFLLSRSSLDVCLLLVLRHERVELVQL